METVTFNEEEQQWPSDQAERQKQAQETTEYCDIPWSLTLRAHLGLYLRGSSHMHAREGLGGHMWRWGH